MPSKPDPYEVRGGKARTIEQTQGVWLAHYGVQQMSMFRPGTTEPIDPELSLGRPPPAQRHSATSREAAELMTGRAGSIRKAIYTWLVMQGDLGATDEEGQESLALPGNTFRPRRVELMEAGLVRDSGATRLTRARRKAVVWLAVPLSETDGQADAQSPESGEDRRLDAAAQP